LTPNGRLEKKHEPASDVDTVAAVGSLKVLDPKWPIREADIDFDAFRHRVYEYTA
jgi:hypothetical protein